jgi:uncharacterized membrane protein (DUF485 family)
MAHYPGQKHHHGSGRALKGDTSHWHLQRSQEGVSLMSSRDVPGDTLEMLTPDQIRKHRELKQKKEQMDLICLTATFTYAAVFMVLAGTVLFACAAAGVFGATSEASFIAFLVLACVMAFLLGGLSYRAFWNRVCGDDE